MEFIEKHEHVEHNGRVICSCGDFNCASLDSAKVHREVSGTVIPERTALEQASFGPGWRRKVRNMHDAQVIAVYLRLKAQGKV